MSSRCAEPSHQRRRRRVGIAGGNGIEQRGRCRPGGTEADGQRGLYRNLTPCPRASSGPMRRIVRTEDSRLDREPGGALVALLMRFTASIARCARSISFSGRLPPGSPSHRQTPNLDRLTKAGARFDNAYTPDPRRSEDREKQLVLVRGDGTPSFMWPIQLGRYSTVSP